MFTRICHTHTHLLQLIAEAPVFSTRGGSKMDFEKAETALITMKGTEDSKSKSFVFELFHEYICVAVRYLYDCI